MSKFPEQYEQYKLPPWYDSYFRYDLARATLKHFDVARLQLDYDKLPGLFYLAEAVNKHSNEKHIVIPVPLLNPGFDEI